MRKRFDVFATAGVSGNFGGERQALSASPAITLWGEFMPALEDTKETEFAGQQQEIKVTVICLRYWGGLTSRHVLSLRPTGRKFAIDAIASVDERNFEMMVRCKEIA